MTNNSKDSHNLPRTHQTNVTAIAVIIIIIITSYNGCQDHKENYKKSKRKLHKSSSMSGNKFVTNSDIPNTIAF